MAERAAQLVVGTAGHIDHGKTSLVRMLTGVDLDTQPEEKERGITIALGFVPFDLPDGRRVAFVDVPGHERLVRTMIAGATGVDAVLLCVSAVDGVMPQTREHLAILSLVGVRSGAVVLTMADLVDEELLELARDDVETLVVGTFLEGAPIVTTSATTGQGREELIEVIQGLDTLERRQDGPFRLPVDRAFTRPGFGTVVTGTVWSGELHDGEQAVLLPSGKPARIRGLQVHGESAEVARAGWRAALNLASIDKDDVPRGTVVATGAVPCPRMIDVVYHHLPGAKPLPDGSPVRFLLGTAEAIGRLCFAADRDELPPGGTTPAQVRLDTPIPCLPGDRFVLRRVSPVETFGGGEVVDPYAPRMRHKHREAWGAQIKRLHAGKVQVWLERAGEEGIAPADWAARAPGSDVGELLGGTLFARPVVARLKGALLEAIERYHSDTPLSVGANRRELRRGRLGHLPDKVFDGLVARMADKGMVVIEGPLVRLTGFEVTPSEDQRTLQAAILGTITDARLTGMKPKELHAKHPEPQVAALAHLLERDDLVRQVPNLGWVATEELSTLRSRIRAYFAEHERMTTGEFKDMTGLSRKSAIPLLEWLDREKITRRSGDDRVKGTAIG